MTASSGAPPPHRARLETWRLLIASQKAVRSMKALPSVGPPSGSPASGRSKSAGSLVQPATGVARTAIATAAVTKVLDQRLRSGAKPGWSQTPPHPEVGGRDKKSVCSSRWSAAQTPVITRRTALPYTKTPVLNNRRVGGTRDEDVLEVWSLAGALLQETRSASSRS